MDKSRDNLRLMSLIENEDSKNPLTDQQLSSLLRVSRSAVTTLRNENGIANSRERRAPSIERDLKEILQKNPDANTRQILTSLNEMGYKITFNSVARYMTDLGFGADKQEQGKPAPARLPDDAFSTLIGSHRSMSMQIEQAKAAVLYPPNGLHTLIIGETGVGKSALAEAMYNYAVAAKGLSQAKMPFIVFNCADYAENPQLLMAQLFGYKKGAFTGANDDRDGLISKADGGMFFLDEVHRMPPDGQEMLFQLIDKGIYRRMGDTQVRNARVMIVAATTEDIETSLLDTFRRRIPMVISLTPLDSRSTDEKYDIIVAFFRQEAMRIKREILVTADAIRSLLSIRYAGNIGELRGKIQVACAKGYLLSMHSQEGQRITVDVEALSLLDDDEPSSAPLGDILKFSSADLIVHPTDSPRMPGTRINDPYEFSDELYRIVEAEYTKLYNNNMSPQDIDAVIWKLMEKKIARFMNQIQTDTAMHHMAESMNTIVDGSIIKMVEEMLEVAEGELGEVDDSLMFCLTTHFNASMERLRNGKRVLNPNLHNIKLEYAREFEVACKMAATAQKHIEVELPDEEIGFIAMYLAAAKPGSLKASNAIGLIVITHGRVAMEMAAVVERLMGDSHVAPLCINLDESPMVIYKRLKELVAQKDRGKGVLILVDMGSPERFGAQIAQETGIRVRTVTRVDTLMVLDAVRKVQLFDADLDDVAESLAEQKSSVVLGKPDGARYKRMAFVCYCLTGQGCASYMLERLQQGIASLCEDVEFELIDALGGMDIGRQVAELKRKYHVIGAAGSFRADLGDTPLLLMGDMQDEQQLNRFYRDVENAVRVAEKDMEQAAESIQVFHEDFIFTGLDFIDKQAAIRFLSDKLLERQCVTKGFFDSAIERENIVPTILEGGVAIPHGLCSEVLRTRIAVLKPSRPIPWGGGLDARLIMLLAFTEDANSLFSRIYNVISNTERVDRIAAAGSKEEMLRLLDGNA